MSTSHQDPAGWTRDRLNDLHYCVDTILFQLQTVLTSRHLSAVISIGFCQQKTKVLLQDLASWSNDLRKKVSMPSNCAPPEVESFLDDFYISIVSLLA